MNFNVKTLSVQESTSIPNQIIDSTDSTFKPTPQTLNLNLKQNNSKLAAKVQYLTFDDLLETSSANLEGILSELYPRPESVYFLETSGRLKLTLKQLCVMESAAKHNPNTTIYLLVVSPILQDDQLQTFQSEYKNIQVKHIHIPSLIHGTPIESLWNRNVIQKSKFLTVHLSDVLRIVILFHFGGTYLDLDALILKPLPEVPSFIGREHLTYETLANGVLRFKKNHPIMEKLLINMNSSFDGQQWAANGPALVTRTLQEFCSQRNLSAMTPETCQGIQIFEPEMFYPVPYWEWNKLFLDEHFDYDVSKSVSIHLWGKMSDGVPLENVPNKTKLYDLLEKNCPFSMSMKNFPPSSII